MLLAFLFVMNLLLLLRTKGGALALLLGNKKFRKKSRKHVAYGEVVALGVLVYRNYKEWKNKAPAKASGTTTQISAVKAHGHMNVQEQKWLDVEFAKLGSTG